MQKNAREFITRTRMPEAIYFRIQPFPPHMLLIRGNKSGVTKVLLAQDYRSLSFFLFHLTGCVKLRASNFWLLLTLPSKIY